MNRGERRSEHINWRPNFNGFALTNSSNIHPATIRLLLSFTTKHTNAVMMMIWPFWANVMTDFVFVLGLYEQNRARIQLANLGSGRLLPGGGVGNFWETSTPPW